METTELLDSLKEYKKFFEEAPVGLCRFDIRTGRFIMANVHCARMFGYEDVSSLLEGTDTLSKLCGRDEKQKLITRLKKEGEIVGYEMKMIPQSSFPIWVSAHLHINCGGTCIQGTLIDITNQKKAEFELESMKSKQLVRMRSINNKLDNMIINYVS
jgi:PAS domain S-box-containing protein